MREGSEKVGGGKEGGTGGGKVKNGRRMKREGKHKEKLGEFEELERWLRG